MEYNYKFFKTDQKDSFEKSVIQSISKINTSDQDVIDLNQDIIDLFKKKDNNYNQEKIYNYIVKKRNDLIFLTIPRESKNIFDLYFKFEKKDKDIYPLFSKKIKKELEPDCIFFNSFNYKYLNFYMDRRIPKKDEKLLSLSLNFIEEKEYRYDLINDVIALNIILLDQNLNYYTTYENKDNDDYVVIKKDDEDNFTNIYFVKNDEELYILSKGKDEELIQYLENNSQSKYKNITETNSLDLILQDIENIEYSLQDFIDMAKTLYKDNKN